MPRERHPSQHVQRDVRPGVAEVGGVVNGGAAGVPRRSGVGEWVREGAVRGGERVVQGHAAGGKETWRDGRLSSSRGGAAWLGAKKGRQEGGEGTTRVHRRSLERDQDRRQGVVEGKSLN